MSFRRTLMPAMFVVAVAAMTQTLMAAPKFPALSGRVVDGAALISTAAERQITELSAAQEKASTNQVVVVTVPDLQGLTIETYGYQLGRHWGIGQSEKNNGVLLIVAKAERQIRIETGYGLEGELTDAIASNIIHGVISPRFKTARFDTGVIEGTKAIIEALGGEYQMRDAATRGDSKKVPPGWSFIFFIIMFFVVPSLFGRRGFWGGLLIGHLLGGSRRRGGFGGGGFGGGGFSGGGGGFGGGGASGGW